MDAKHAESVGSATPDPIAGQASTFPVPPVAIANKPAPGQTGPRGMGPRQTYSRVNTGVPPVPDAGAQAQKSGPNRGLASLPKLAEVHMNNPQMMRRSTLDELVKAASEGTLSRSDINAEIAHHLGGGTGTTKTASAQSNDNPHLATEQIQKLASAVGYAADLILKEAEATPGEGPGALTVTETAVSGKGLEPGQSGKATAAHQPPVNPPLQAEKVQQGNSGTGLQTDDENMPGKSGLDTEPGKVASDALFQKNANRMMALLGAGKGLAGKAVAGVKAHPKATAGLALGGLAAGAAAGSALGKKKEGSDFATLVRAKLAEDAINPAQISSGTASDANTAPDGAAPSGEGNLPSPSQASLISSNQAAIDLTRREAKAGVKSELGKVLNEPALSASTDSVLSQALSHTGESGAKIAMARQEVLKTAAARALLHQAIKSASGDAVAATPKGKEKASAGIGSAPTTPAQASGFTASSI